MVSEVVSEANHLQARASQKSADLQFELTRGLSRSVPFKKACFEPTISLAFAPIALLLPLCALMFTAGNKLLNQDFSENILRLPAYTQGIWALIYALLLALIIWQSLASVRTNQRIRSAVFPIAISGVINAIWLLVDAPIFSLGLELMWLSSLVFAYRFLGVDLAKATRKAWIAQAAMGLYLGWVAVTTSITVSHLLLFSSWNGLLLPSVFWASTVILSLASLGLFLALHFNDTFFNLALVWAFAGYVFRSPLDPALMPALMVALASTVFSIVREPKKKSRSISLESRQTTSNL